MKKIALLTSPFFDYWVSQPYLSVPLMSGQLKFAGYDTCCYDIALEFSQDVLKKQYIENSHSKINELNNSLEYKNCDKQILCKKQYIDKYADTWYKILTDNLEFKQNKYPPQQLLDIGYKYALLPYLYEKKMYNLNYDSIKQHCFDTNTNFFISYLKNKIQKIPQNAELICISVLPDFEIYPTLTLARLLKENFKNSKIVLGGYWFTSVADFLSKTPDIFDVFCDYIIIGNYPDSIVELAKFIDNKRDINSVSGLLYKDIDNVVHQNSFNNNFNIDDVKYANYDDYNFNNYFSDKKTISMMITKGCYWGKCKFCSYTKGAKYQIKNIYNVINEIKYYVDKYNIEQVHFVDDAIPPQYYNDLAQEIIKSKIKINFSSFAIFDAGYTEEIFSNLKQAGLTTLIWGLETNSERLFKLINKSGCYEKRSEILKNSHLSGINNIVNIIDGLPQEDVKDIAKTVIFLYQNLDYIDSLTIQKFQLRVNTEFAKYPQKYNLQVDNNKEDFALYYKYRKTNSVNKDFSLYEHYQQVTKEHKNIKFSKELLKIFVHTYIKKHQELFPEIDLIYTE